MQQLCKLRCIYHAGTASKRRADCRLVVDEGNHVALEDRLLQEANTIGTAA